MRLALGAAAMLALTHANPQFPAPHRALAVCLGIVLLFMVAVRGVIGKGAQRWLNLGLFRFQPSEIMKLAVPMLAAWYLHERPCRRTGSRCWCSRVIIFLPAGLVAMQPDLGTAALIAASGVLLVLMAGLSMRIMLVLAAAGRGRRRARLELHAWLPARARADLPQPADRSARRRLSHHPESDRHRLGRRVRQGLDERQSGAARILCPSAPRTSSSRWSARNSGSSAWSALLALYLFIVARAVWLAMQTNDTFSRLLR